MKNNADTRILLLGAGRRPSQGSACVFLLLLLLFFYIFCVPNFLNFARLQSPKLGYKAKIREVEILSF